MQHVYQLLDGSGKEHLITASSVIDAINIYLCYPVDIDDLLSVVQIDDEEDVEIRLIAQEGQPLVVKKAKEWAVGQSQMINGASF